MNSELQGIREISRDSAEVPGRCETIQEEETIAQQDENRQDNQVVLRSALRSAKTSRRVKFLRDHDKTDGDEVDDEKESYSQLSLAKGEIEKSLDAIERRDVEKARVNAQSAMEALWSAIYSLDQALSSSSSTPSSSELREKQNLQGIPSPKTLFQSALKQKQVVEVSETKTAAKLSKSSAKKKFNVSRTMQPVDGCILTPLHMPD